jgi:hypothetical protein
MTAVGTGSNTESHYSLHFLIYDVAYVGILAGLLFDLWKFPEPPETWRLWLIEASLVAMYVIDCLHTRAHLRSFDPAIATPGENFLNFCIAIAFGFAYSALRKEHFTTTYGILTGVVLYATARNAYKVKTREITWHPILLDLLLLLAYLSLAVVGFMYREWFSTPFGVGSAWLPTLFYAVYTLRWKNV